MAAGESECDSLEKLEDFSDSGSDYEATIKTTKRRKHAVPGPQPPKRPRRKAALRVTSSPHNRPIPAPVDPSLQQQQQNSRGSSRQVSPRLARGVNERNQGISAKDIYDAVCLGKSAMVTVVDEWLDSYKQSREVGLLVLINFIVRSCGCKGVVSREMLDSMQNAEIISSLTKEFNEDSVNYPLCTPGPQLKRFKDGLCEFAKVLVRSCRNSLIYDEYLFPSLLALLTGLSDSQVRAFRHTSTLLAMKLMTGLVEVAVIVSVQLQTTQRRYDVENSKKPHDRAPDRLEELQATISELQEKREELSSMMNATFRGVFVHRYRDRLTEIRVVCIEDLGMWLKIDPEDFLNDGCLKYVGWTLHDKQSPVRLQCVRALQGLYQEKEFIGRLELFTSRFKEDRRGPEGGGVWSHLSPSLCFTPRPGVCSRHLPLQQFHEHGAYLVDSLWTVAGSELRDWETMTTLLLQEAGLTDQEEGALIELMMCAIRQAAQTTSPVGRAQGKKLLSMKDKKIQEQDRRRITTHFIPLLPQLLTKHLDLLLSQVCGIVNKHTEATVLEACTHLACALCSDMYTFSSRAHLAFSQLLDSLTECFNVYLSDLLQGTADDSDMYSAATALKRIAALCGAEDPTGWKLFDPCVELLRSRLESGELDKELMVSALKCAAFHLMWAKVNAVNFKPTEAELTRLRRELRSFCRVCQTCLTVNQAEIRDQAFQLLCDLLMLYSKSSVRSEPALKSLVHLPSDSLRSEMAAFLLDYIFTDSEDAELNVEGEEMKITLLQRKRNQLAGYCKLVIYGVLDLSAATDVFKHYSKYFKDFGDIIKETMSKSKLINPVLSAKTVCLSLQQLFSEMLTEEHSRKDLNEIRDLGKRLAMSFGIDLHRVRKPLVALHMDGIHFALRGPQEEEEQLPNVAFLEILSEFSFKLLQQDRVQMASLLKSECPSAAISWPPVRMYQQSLKARFTSRPREQEGGGDAVSSHDTPVAKRRKSTAQGSVSSNVRGSWLDSSSLHSDLHTPALTSTAQRQPAKPLASSKPTAAESDISSVLNEPESEDEFSSGPQMRRVKPTKRRQLHSTLTSLDHQDLNSNLTLLSLIKDDDAEREEAEIENYDSDHESGYTLPSTRHNSASFMDELFD